MVNHSIGLLILICVNIALGSIGSLFVNRFDWRRLLRGIAKGVVVVACFMATYFAGCLNPDILAVNVGGVEANVMTALNLVVMAGYIHYAKQVFEKLVAMLGDDFKDDMKDRFK